MMPAAIFSLLSLTLFSLADLRYRVVPGAALYFLGSVLLAAPDEPLRVSLVVLAVGWGWLGWRAILMIPALFAPSAWAVLLAGAGRRGGWVGEADVLVLGGIACLFDWPGAVFVLVGVQVWRWYWGRRRFHKMPALPGMLIGLVAYLSWI